MFAMEAVPVIVDSRCINSLWITSEKEEHANSIKQTEILVVPVHEVDSNSRTCQ